MKTALRRSGPVGTPSESDPSFYQRQQTPPFAFPRSVSPPHPPPPALRCNSAGHVPGCVHIEATTSGSSRGPGFQQIDQVPQMQHVQMLQPLYHETNRQSSSNLQATGNFQAGGTPRSGILAQNISNSTKVAEESTPSSGKPLPTGGIWQTDI